MSASDVPLVEQAVKLNNPTDNQVTGLQAWFLDRNSFATLNIGTTVFPSDAGLFSLWPNILRRYRGITAGLFDGFSGPNNAWLLGNYSAGNYSAQNMVSIASPLTGPYPFTQKYPINWLGTNYLILSMDQLSGQVILGDINGGLSVQTVWAGPDNAQAAQAPPCFPDQGSGFNYFLQDGANSISSPPSIVAVQNGNAANSVYSFVTLSDATYNALFFNAARNGFAAVATILPNGFGIWVPGGIIVLSPDATKFWFYAFQGSDTLTAQIIGNPATFIPGTVGVIITAEGRVYFNRADTGQPNQIIFADLAPLRDTLNSIGLGCWPCDHNAQGIR